MEKLKVLVLIVLFALVPLAPVDAESSQEGDSFLHWMEEMELRVSACEAKARDLLMEVAELREQLDSAKPRHEEGAVSVISRGSLTRGGVRVLVANSFSTEQWVTLSYTLVCRGEKLFDAGGRKSGPYLVPPGETTVQVEAPHCSRGGWVDRMAQFEIELFSPD